MAGREIDSLTGTKLRVIIREFAWEATETPVSVAIGATLGQTTPIKLRRIAPAQSVAETSAASTRGIIHVQARIAGDHQFRRFVQ
jgi:hypothetical protein